MSWVKFVRAVAAVGGVLLLPFLLAGTAAAQSCSFAMTDANFGTVNLQSGSPIDTTATFSATCQGLASSTVRVCASFGAGSGGAAGTGAPRYMLSGATQLAYNLYSDAARTSPLGGYSGLLSLLGGATLSVPLNASGKGTASFAVYGRIPAGQSATPPGTYQSSFAGSETSVYYQYVSILTCGQILNGTTSRVPFTVLATVPTSCTVSATNMNFGSVASLASAVNATSTVTANCTITTPYEVAFNGGVSGANDPTQRVMSNGSYILKYGLYRNSQRTLPWGNVSGSTTAAGVGTGSAQQITVYGTVPQGPTPVPGVYSDTIVVTLTY
jgi:spore coat protein U-like protein